MQNKLPSPFPLLKDFLPLIPKGLALDIGCGLGQNSIFLAKNGFQVETIDINKKNLAFIKSCSKKMHLKIKTELIDVRKKNLPPKQYHLIIAIQSLVFLKKAEFKRMTVKIKNALKENGIVIISGFNIYDDTFERFKKNYKTVEENTYKTNNTKQYWHFLKPNELKKLFKENAFEILYYEEKIFREKPHFGIPYAHNHGIAQIVAKKRAPDTIQIN